ncbi:DUF4245 domain-containing protein [Humibacter ginsenosidimutans]|uniref:DUF4245 domain-containing protein n=1 Tax=Humibacter ginsenosidimutans TaxID=2599293 RepID=A0A5B8M493_9MICO|nr:DUF4245 domain-containing protein [Humibacter ginsenosidimutans]QDZ14410.1 DUF4245 domain-containing protein [Humibacter ginsenosidimutans]
MARNEHPVVAELGRPETAAETATRKAQASADHRRRQTVNNLIYSLLATLGLVVVIVLMVPRAQPDATPDIDYAKIAAQGAGVEPDPLLTPHLSKSWTSNSAELRQQTQDQVDEWYIGLITPSKQYIGLTQGFDANATWLADQVANTHSVSTTEIDGITWSIYDNRDSSRDVGDAQYALSTKQGKSTVVLYGTASNAEFQTLAKSVSSQLNKDAKGH